MKKWYAIKRKTDTQWVMYQIPKSHLKHLKDEYEYRGPFKSIVAAMVKLDKERNI